MAIDFDALVLAPAMAAFGQDIVYSPKAGGSLLITGVFDRYATSIDFGADGVPTTTRRPQLGLRQADLPPGIVPQQGDWVTVNGTLLFRVVDVRPDGIGGLTLVLGNRSDDGA